MQSLRAQSRVLLLLVVLLGAVVPGCCVRVSSDQSGSEKVSGSNEDRETDKNDGKEETNIFSENDHTRVQEALQMGEDMEEESEEEMHQSRKNRTPFKKQKKRTENQDTSVTQKVRRVTVNVKEDQVVKDGQLSHHENVMNDEPAADSGININNLDIELGEDPEIQQTAQGMSINEQAKGMTDSGININNLDIELGEDPDIQQIAQDMSINEQAKGMTNKEEKKEKTLNKEEKKEKTFASCPVQSEDLNILQKLLVDLAKLEQEITEKRAEKLAEITALGSQWRNIDELRRDERLDGIQENEQLERDTMRLRHDAWRLQKKLKDLRAAKQKLQNQLEEVSWCKSKGSKHDVATALFLIGMVSSAVMASNEEDANKQVGWWLAVAWNFFLGSASQVYKACDTQTTSNNN